MGKISSPGRKTYFQIESACQKAQLGSDNSDKNHLLCITKGNPEARYRLAECWYYGDVYEKDETKAFRIFEKLAKRGHHWAQYMLGDCFENGMAQS